MERLEQQPGAGAHPMVRVLAQIRGVGVETADMLAHEAFSRPLRDQRAVARGACSSGRPKAGPGGRSDRLAGRERGSPAGEGPGSGGQCPRAPRD